MCKQIVTPVMVMKDNGHSMLYRKDSNNFFLCVKPLDRYWHFPKDGKRFWLVGSKEKRPNAVKFSLKRTETGTWRWRREAARNYGYRGYFWTEFKSWLGETFPNMKVGKSITFWVTLEYEE